MGLSGRNGGLIQYEKWVFSRMWLRIRWAHNLIESSPGRWRGRRAAWGAETLAEWAVGENEQGRARQSHVPRAVFPARPLFFCATLSRSRAFSEPWYLIYKWGMWTHWPLRSAVPTLTLKWLWALWWLPSEGWEDLRLKYPGALINHWCSFWVL